MTPVGAGSDDVPEWLHDLLLPETDRGAVTQWVVGALFWVVVLVATRSWRREYRVFLGGLAMVTVAWFAVRTVH